MGIQIDWTAANTYLVLDEKLDTLDGSGGGLGDGGRDTTHWRRQSAYALFSPSWGAGLPELWKPVWPSHQRRNRYQQSLRLDELNRVDGEEMALRLSRIRTQEVRHEGLL